MVTKKITFVKQVKNQDSKDRAADKKTVDPDRIGASDRSSKTGRPKRVCLFCQNETNPTYTDLAILRRFLTDRAKIVAKERSGVCSKHQRAVAKNIKYARHLALLPFVPKV